MAKAKRQTPDRDEVDALVREYRRKKQAALRDRLIAQHLYLVQTAARKFAGLGESHEDLLQEGAMGLINAVDLYDPDRGVQFSTYATHLVEGQIRHYLRDRGKLIKQPAWVQELTTKIIKASDALTQELNRVPTHQEIAEVVGTTPENVRRMLDARERSKVASLDAARGEDDEQGPAIDPEKLRTEDLGGLHLPVEDRIFLREAMSRLKTLEQKVVHNFYYLDLNQTEIARKLGISVNYASYLLRGGIAQLKKAFEAQGQRESVFESRESNLESPISNLGQAYSLSARPAPSDPITKVATEGYLVERLEQEVSRASRYPQQFSLVLVEPDCDEIARDQLVELARLLRANCRSIDLVARMSAGDRRPGARFGLLLPHTGREASVLSERICRTVALRLSTPAGDHRPAGDRPPEAALTVSTGFAVFPANGRSAEDLLASAQRALIEAKEQGGNCAVRAEPMRRGKSRPQAAVG
jgi:RNA polymerase sigma-B factor